MAAQLDVIWVPSATDIALAGVIAFAESATRRLRAGAQALTPQAKSPRKVSTATTSPGSAS